MHPYKPKFKGSLYSIQNIKLELSRQSLGVGAPVILYINSARSLDHYDTSNTVLGPLLKVLYFKKWDKFFNLDTITHNY